MSISTVLSQSSFILTLTAFQWIWNWTLKHCNHCLFNTEFSPCWKRRMNPMAPDWSVQLSINCIFLLTCSCGEFHSGSTNYRNDFLSSPARGLLGLVFVCLFVCLLVCQKSESRHVITLTLYRKQLIWSTWWQSSNRELVKPCQCFVLFCFFPTQTKACLWKCNILLVCKISSIF